MTDLLASTAAALVIAAAGLAVLLALTLAPFAAAVTLAERRGAGPSRWGAYAGAGVVVGLGCLYVVHRAHLPLTVAALGVAAAWSAPLALVVLGDSGGRLAGRSGRHE